MSAQVWHRPITKSAAVMGLLAIGFLLAGTTTGWSRDRWQALYTSANLAGHQISVESSPGDPTTNCGCTTADVQLVSYADYGTVTANSRLTNIYANAIGFKRFEDVLPDGSPVRLDVFKYQADLRLPVVPMPNVAQTQNAEAVHIMIQLWDGSNRVWQADKVALEATVFWDLNPWRTNEHGALKVYTSTTGGLALVNTGLTLPVDTNWHRIEFVADFANGKFVSVCADGVRADVSTVAIARVYRPTWGNELICHITQESCSTYPGPGYLYIFTWTTEYRNIAFSRLAFTADFGSEPPPASQRTLQWNSEPYLKYQVSTSQDLGTWYPMPDTLVGDGTTKQYSVSITDDQRMFYRIGVVP